MRPDDRAVSRFSKMAWAVMVVPVLLCGSAKADEDAATTALKRGYELKKAGKCAEAVVFLRESFEKKPSAKAVLNLAECEESSGKFLTARTHYRDGKRLSELEKQPELLALAETRLAAIEPRIPHVTFVAPEGTEVSLDGGPKGQASDMEVDPGDHRAKVTREGYQEGAETFSLVPGERKTVRLTLGEKRAVGTGSSAPATGTTEAGGSGSGQRIAGGLAFGGGLVLVGMGSVLALTAKSSYDSAVKASCDAQGCDPAGRDAIRSARGRADVATVLFVVGGVATAAGAVIYLTAKTSAVRAALAGPGVVVSGTF